ncbi:MAG: hypothetical protein GY769_13125 [bacterium]|nr:hypothetical protein [bacterium]
MDDTKRALAAIARPTVLARLEALQTPVDVKFEPVANGLAFQAYAWRRAFDLLVAELPFSGLEPANCLRTLRSKESASVNSPLLFLVQEGYERNLTYISPSLLRLVTICTNLSQALRVVTDTLKLRDRSSVHLFAEAEMIVDSVRFHRVCQIENVSQSGMLLRTNRFLPVGSVLPFTLRLPDDETPIYGRGEVVRHTDEATEAVSGMGVRFFGLDGDGGSRLDGFLQAQQH